LIVCQCWGFWLPPSIIVRPFILPFTALKEQDLSYSNGSGICLSKLGLLHLLIRWYASRIPFIKPYFSIAWREYSEQEGEKLHSTLNKCSPPPLDWYNAISFRSSHFIYRPNVTIIDSRVQKSHNLFVSTNWNTTCQPSAPFLLSTELIFFSGKLAEPKRTALHPLSDIRITLYSWYLLSFIITLFFSKI